MVYETYFNRCIKIGAGVALTVLTVLGATAVAAETVKIDPSTPETPIVVEINGETRRYTPEDDRMQMGFRVTEEAAKLFDQASEAYTAKDYEKALYLFSMASNKYHPQASYNRSVMVVKGEGTKPDLKSAIRNMENAAFMGHPQALAALEVLKKDGPAPRPD